MAVRPFPTMLERITEAEQSLEEQGGLIMTKEALGPWSASKLKCLDKCPYQFYLKYVLKIKPDLDHVQDTAMADVGTSAHKILEHLVLGRGIGEAYALAKAEHCVPIEDAKPGVANLSEEDWKNKILTLENNIILFKERLDTFAKNNKIKKVLTELRIGITREWMPTTFFAKNVYFRGIIDLCLQIEVDGYAPDLLIIDHKHGGGEFGGIKNYETQLDIYKPLFHHGIEKCSGAQAGINFVKAGRLVLGDYTDAEDIESKLVPKLEWLISGAIDTVKELGYWKHIRGQPCVYCEYNVKCKAGEFKSNELSTKKYFKIKEIK